MRQTVTTLLANEGILLSAPIRLCSCTVTRPYLLERVGISDGTAFMFAVPYYTTECDDPARNISVYAVSRDYHLFFKELFERILPILREKFPTHRFAGFSDHSPIAEPEAAARAGLGFFGCHHLFLTNAHSSFVFLGEIITDAILDTPTHDICQCDQCHACERACPVGLDISRCHSALTQKKGALSDTERAQLLQQGSAWGCDLCQMACPITKRARAAGTLYTTIPFFKESALAHPDRDALLAMSDDDFAERAYSWRGRAVILRNLEILEEGEHT